MMGRYDLIVIGGGSAGYAAALRAAEMGATTLLIEKDALGGTCVNRGCIPTKFMLEVAHATKVVDKLKAFGLRGSCEPIDLREVAARRNSVVRGIVDGIDSMLQVAGVVVEKGSACFESPRDLVVSKPDGTILKVTAPRIAVCTGSLPMSTKILGLEEDEVVDSEKTFDLEYVPESLLVVGAGAVGLEMATIYNGLGSRVTVIDKMPRVLPREDAEMGGYLKELMEQAGVYFHLGAVISKLRGAENGHKVVEVSDGERVMEMSAHAVIAAHGRVPNIAGLRLDGIGVDVKGGAIKTDVRMRTNVEGIYAAGDVTGGPMLSHVASAQARVAVDNALGKSGRFTARVVPRCMYTSPELACVGLTEEEAREKGYSIKIGTSSLTANPRAATMAEREGVVKVIADAANGDLLGVHILGPLASEMLAAAVVAMELECTTADLARGYQAHPTLAEAVVEAVRAAN